MKNHFFQAAHPLWYLPCVGGLTFLSITTFWPDQMPYYYFSFFGQLAKYLAYHYHFLLVIIWIAAMLTHVYEAVVARRLCQKLKFDRNSTWKWIVQTLLLGYPSLSILKRYAERKR